MNDRFLEIATDPRIIPGVHHSCDEWCDYCPVTNRCLAFLCSDELRRQRGRPRGAPFTSIDEAVAFTRDLATIEGMPTGAGRLPYRPEESAIRTADPLVLLAWEYAERIAVAFAPALPNVCGAPRQSGPKPEEVVLWYHLRIYMRLFRALVGTERTRLRSRANVEEVVGSAKLALVSVQRSRRALQSLRTAANTNDIAELVSVLDTLERGIDERVPDARSFVRLGLDVPVA